MFCVNVSGIYELGNYYKQLYTIRSESLEKSYKILDTYNLPKLNHETVNNLNSPITRTEIAIIKSLPTKKNPELDGFIDKICQTFQEVLSPILHNLFNRKGGKPSKLYETNITLILKPDRDTTEHGN